MSNMNDLIDSEYVSIIINIVKLMFSLLAVNHFVACLWFLLSRAIGNGKGCDEVLQMGMIGKALEPPERIPGDKLSLL